MTKVAVYGFVRIALICWARPNGGGACRARHWRRDGGAGVLYALMQADLKRALAFSTIENIGIIFVGLGLALAFSANGMKAAGALALTAALFHALNPRAVQEPCCFSAPARCCTARRRATWSGSAASSMPCR